MRSVFNVQDTWLAHGDAARAQHRAVRSSAAFNRAQSWVRRLKPGCMLSDCIDLTDRGPASLQVPRHSVHGVLGSGSGDAPLEHSRRLPLQSHVSNNMLQTEGDSVTIWLTGQTGSAVTRFLLCITSAVMQACTCCGHHASMTTFSMPWPDPGRLSPSLRHRGQAQRVGGEVSRACTQQRS